VNPNDVVVHCASAQSVTLAALGAEAWWVAVGTFALTAVVTTFFFHRSNEKEREEMRVRLRATEETYNNEQRQYHNERADLRKEREKYKAEHLALLERLNAGTGR
jgi:membrane protein implicated in regulation of membrane protease activity